MMFTSFLMRLVNTLALETSDPKSADHLGAFEWRHFKKSKRRGMAWRGRVRLCRAGLGEAWLGEVRQRKGSGSGSVLPFPVLLILARSSKSGLGRVRRVKAR